MTLPRRRATLKIDRAARSRARTPRKMLQPISKKCFAVCALALSLTLTAGAQSSSSTQQPVAAPGTVAITAKNAAALTAPYTGPKYSNRWEIYGGLLFMNGQAGQNTPVRYNMGGGDVMGTYWIGAQPGTHHVPKWGIIGDYRFGAGTTPVLSPYYNRVLIIQSIQSGGVTYRGPHNRYAAINFQALAGGAYGHFDYAVNHYPGGSPVSSCPAQQKPNQDGTLGLYCDHVAPYGSVGGSIDFNQSQKFAVRLQPQMVFEHYGTETREFFAISMGALYRFGKK
jgi:hypothetical protein